MRPVDQTVFTVPGGNCFSACVATLLELELDDVPYFMGDEPPDQPSEWFERFAGWLARFGFYPLYCALGGDNRWRPHGLHILSGLSPRAAELGETWQHCVVARGTEIIHDPHPSRAGVLSHDDVVVLVPFDPRRTHRP